MKKGIVIEIKDNRATVMVSGGSFLSLPAEADWKKGDVVSVHAKSSKNSETAQNAMGMVKSKTWRALGAVAACLVVLIPLSIFGGTLYYTPEALVSLDVNPSIELSVNRFDRIIGVRAYNEEGETILQQSNLRNQKVQDAVRTLIAQELDPYLKTSPYLTFSVETEDQNYENQLMDTLRTAISTVSDLDPQLANLGVDYYAVDDSTVERAHSHHITAGKYVTLMQLQEYMPEMQIEQYSHCGIGEIKEQIHSCASAHGRSGSGTSDIQPSGSGTSKGGPAVGGEMEHGQSHRSEHNRGHNH